MSNQPFTFPPQQWYNTDGKVVSCTEKIKVLQQNFEELQQMAQDAFEDALLMDVDESYIRSVFLEMINQLHNPYSKPMN